MARCSSINIYIVAISSTGGGANPSVLHLMDCLYTN